jgi:hypothetical protein
VTAGCRRVRCHDRWSEFARSLIAAFLLGSTALAFAAQMLPPNRVATARHADGRELTLLYSEVSRTCPDGWNVVQEDRTHQRIGCWRFTLAGGVEILWDNGNRVTFPREYFSDTPQYRLWREHQATQKDSTEPVDPAAPGLARDLHGSRALPPLRAQ